MDAEKTFRDFSRRLSQKAFALRIQVTAPGRLPPGIVEAVAAAISPLEPARAAHLERERAVSAYEVRSPDNVAERRAGRVESGHLGSTSAMLTGQAGDLGPPGPA